MKLKDLAFHFNKEKFYIASGLCLGGAVFVIYFLTKYVPMYSSVARLFIRNIPQSSVVTPYGEDSLVKSESGYSNPLFNYMEILHSEKLAYNVYVKLLKTKSSESIKDDLKRLNADSVQSWNMLFSDLIESKVEPSTDIIKITIKWDNPKTTLLVFNTLIDEFRATNLEIRRSSLTQRRAYLDQQMKEIGTNLDNVRLAIKNYRLRNRTIDIPIESAQLTGARVDLQKQMDVLKSQVRGEQVKMHNLSTQLGYPDGKTALRASGIGGDPHLVKLNQELASAEQRESRLAATQTEEHPERKQAMSEIDSLKKSIEERQSEILGGNPMIKGSYDAPSQNVAIDLSRTQADYRAHSAQLKTLGQGVSNFINRENELPLKQLGLDELKKKEQALATAYDSISQKQIEAKIKELQVDDNLVPLDPPSVPKPIQKDLIIKLVALLILGGLGGFAIGWIQDYIEDRWKNPEEMEERTGQTVLGVLPWEKDLSKSQEYLDPNSPSAVAYAGLANSFLMKAYREGVKAVSFVSTAPSRHGSPVTFNIASQLARLGKSVLLLNVNPSDAYHPEQAPTWDLSQLVTEINALIWRKAEITDQTVYDLLPNALLIRDSGNNNNPLHYLSAQNTKSNLYDVVGSNGFQTLLSVLKERYDFIIIDTPAKPFTYPEVQTLLQTSDSVVVISGMDSNRKGVFAVLNKLQATRTKVLGIVARHKHRQDA